MAGVEVDGNTLGRPGPLGPGDIVRDGESSGHRTIRLHGAEGIVEIDPEAIIDTDSDMPDEELYRLSKYLTHQIRTAKPVPGEAPVTMTSNNVPDRRLSIGDQLIEIRVRNAVLKRRESRKP